MDLDQGQPVINSSTFGLSEEKTKESPIEFIHNMFPEFEISLIEFIFCEHNSIEASVEVLLLLNGAEINPCEEETEIKDFNDLKRTIEELEANSKIQKNVLSSVHKNTLDDSIDNSFLINSSPSIQDPSSEDRLTVDLLYSMFPNLSSETIQNQLLKCQQECSDEDHKRNSQKILDVLLNLSALQEEDSEQVSQFHSISSSACLPIEMPRLSKHISPKNVKTKQAAVSDVRCIQMNLASKLRFQNLCDEFPFVDKEILKAIYLSSEQSRDKSLQTLEELYLQPISQERQRTNQRSCSTKDHMERNFCAARFEPDNPGGLNSHDSSNAKEQVSYCQCGSSRNNEKLNGSVNHGSQAFLIQGNKPEDRSIHMESFHKPKGKKHKKKDISNDKLCKSFVKLRDQSFRSSAQAFSSGEKARAERLIALGRQYHRSLLDLHQESSIEPLGKKKSLRCLHDCLFVDFHGLFVKDALKVLDALIQFCKNKNIRVLSIVTGAGIHSVRGIAKLRPAVENYLIERSFVFHEPNHGQIIVQIPN